MKNAAKSLLLVLFVMGLAGCSSVTVNYDFDPTANFQEFKTFGWMPIHAQDPVTKAGSDLVAKRIRMAITNDLLSKGLTENPDNPDLLVAFHTGVQEKVQVTDWGYNYSNYYWGYPTRDIDVYSYTQGQLVIDLVKGATENLVWRGSGTKMLDSGQKSPEKMQETINQAVGKIMESFPPSGK